MNATYRIGCWTFALVLLMVLSARSIDQVRAQAQDEPAVADEAAAEKSETGQESLGQVIFSGDWFGTIFYGVLGLFSVVALSVTLERLVNLRRRKVLPPAFNVRLQELIQKSDDTLDNLRVLSDSIVSPVANILKAGIVRAGRPLPEVEKAMEDTAAREMAEMRSRNRPLSIVGNVAPLVGLLGTVVGMIFAFRVSSQEGLGKAELLAEGIYLALMTTAAGLTIAIPCLLLVAWFNGRVERFMREIDECLLETMPSFTRLEKAEARSTAESPLSTAVAAK